MTLAEFDALWERRHESDAFDACFEAAQTADNFDWQWRMARLAHFAGMQAQEEGDNTSALEQFGIGKTAADLALNEKPRRVEASFWLATCELERARLRGPIALASILNRCQKLLERASAVDETFHFAGPVRVLGRVTQLKPLVLGGSLDRALTFYERALQIAPRNSTSRLYFADALLSDRQPLRAREALGQVIEDSDPHNWAWETARDQKLARAWLGSRFD
jgi:tetratricopeptide (TPR) repeat protein